jgi:hypothetical protein
VITFEQAIAHTENLLNTDPIDDHELQQAIADLIATDNGARGFFVTYLTGDWAIADHPPESVIQALRYGSIYVFEPIAPKVINCKHRVQSESKSGQPN